MIEENLFWIELVLIAIGLVWVFFAPKPGSNKKPPQAHSQPFLGTLLKKVEVGMGNVVKALKTSYSTPKWYGYHLLIYGSTGKGKSTYVEYALQQIVKTIPEAQFIVINPHHRRGQWGLQDCIGGGREYESIEQGINDVLELMDTRYTVYYNDCNATFSDVFVVIDELPAITQNTTKGVVGNALKQLSSEARKVNIWLVILSQSKLVKQLGFDRASDMLDNFVCINVAKPVAKYTIDGEDIEEQFKVVKVDLSGKEYKND